jgi:acyl-CoA reductase-like NAD-dependent aldehyde dehydrogenase
MTAVVTEAEDSQPLAVGRPALTMTVPMRRWLEDVHDLQIGGEQKPGHGGRMTTEDPATGEILAEVACANAVDVDEAVDVARRAVEDRRWSGLSPDQRATAMFEAASLLESSAADLAEIETLDVGKPLAQANADVAVAAGIFRYYAGWTTKLHGTLNPTGDDFVSISIREPRGVCAAITPWNYPIVMAALKIAPAIACGNSVVLKPAEQTPLTALLIGETCARAGIPSGVVNVVPGIGEIAGGALAAHGDIDLVSFTGSTGVGQAIIAASAGTVTPLLLELGGKSANIVCADADLDAAVGGAMTGIWTNAGQWCVAGSRLLVERAVYQEVVGRLVAATATLRLGHGLDPTTDIGPLVSRAQQRRVESYLDMGTREGATVAIGGSIPRRPGYFSNPTIFTDVNPRMRIAREEIFGPVLAVIAFEGDEEAIAIANATRFGLAAGIWSSDPARIQRLSRRLQAGIIWVNTYGVFDYATTYGGVKGSGFGRELGPSSLEAYTTVKSVLTKVTPGN